MLEKLTFNDIIPHDCDVAISVWTRLLVVETQGVSQEWKNEFSDPLKFGFYRREVSQAPAKIKVREEEASHLN